ncbi:MAG: hypothetical protein LBT43_00775 [Prevotella sp.]|uniref:hypothetical protein n=1 Tax=Dysgonomonas sp. GY75 TaxID=2780419 RepID=UPI001A7EA395|nr:hypothetical protein [Dysgonomonas sp. GY75]MDR1500974.1 hypothetical protein [Prevotella sp.]
MIRDLACEAETMTHIKIAGRGILWQGPYPGYCKTFTIYNTIFYSSFASCLIRIRNPKPGTKAALLTNLHIRLSYAAPPISCKFFLSFFIFSPGSLACLSFCIPAGFYLATISSFFVFYSSHFLWMMKQDAI